MHPAQNPEGAAVGQLYDAIAVRDAETSVCGNVTADAGDYILSDTDGHLSVVGAADFHDLFRGYDGDDKKRLDAWKREDAKDAKEAKDAKD